MSDSVSTAEFRESRNRTPLRRVLIVTHAGIAALFAIAAIVSVVVIDQQHHDATIRYGATRDAQSLAAAVALAWDRPVTLVGAINEQTSIRDSVMIVGGRSRTLDGRLPTIASSGPPTSAATQAHAASGLTGQTAAQLATQGGHHVVVAWAPVRHDNRIVASVVLVEPVDPSLPHTAGLLVLVLLGVAAVVAAGLLGWLVARRVSTPIEELADVVYERAVGSDTPPSFPRRLVREVAMLATTLESALGRTNRDTRAQLRRSERQRTLVQQVSHNLRTPLSVLDLRLQQLELLESNSLADDPDLHVERARLLAKLRAQVDVLEQQVGEVVERTRSDPADEHTEVVDLAVVVANRLRSTRPLLDHRKAELVTDLKPGSVVEGSRAELEAVIDELVVNAVKFAPPRSVVKVSVRADEQSGTALLAVADNGPGVTPAERTEVLGEGVRGKGAAPGTGTGLGLYLVSQIVTRLDGSLHLREAEQGGLEVRVVIPLFEPRPPADPEPIVLEDIPPEHAGHPASG